MAKKTSSPSHKLLIALASAAVVGILFFGWVSLLLHMTRDSGTTAPPPRPQSPTAAPKVSDATEAARPAALLPASANAADSH